MGDSFRQIEDSYVQNGREGEHPEADEMLEDSVISGAPRLLEDSVMSGAPLLLEDSVMSNNDHDRNDSNQPLVVAVAAVTPIKGGLASKSLTPKGMTPKGMTPKGVHFSETSPSLSATSLANLDTSTPRRNGEGGGGGDGGIGDDKEASSNDVKQQLQVQVQQDDLPPQEDIQPGDSEKNNDNDDDDGGDGSSEGPMTARSTLSRGFSTFSDKSSKSSDDDDEGEGEEEEEEEDEGGFGVEAGVGVGEEEDWGMGNLDDDSVDLSEMARLRAEEEARRKAAQNLVLHRRQVMDIRPRHPIINRQITGLSSVAAR